MNEENKNLTPDAENEPDETVTELNNAEESPNENETNPVEEAQKPTDDDVLNEIKEALDKAEKNEDERDILTGTSASDNRFERITEDDFKVPDHIASEPVEHSDIEKTKVVESEPIEKHYDRVGVSNKRPPADRREDKTADQSKKRSPMKIVLFIIAIIAVAAAAFALVHFVIAPKLSGNNNKDAAQTSAEAETVAPTESVYEAKAADTLSTMSQREKICQLFVVTPELLMNTDIVTIADNTTAESLANYPVGGVILTQQNTIGDDQTKALISGLQNNSKLPLFIARDNDAIITEQAYESQQNADTTADGAYNTAVAAAQQMSNLGFNVDFSLSADLSDVRASKSDLTDAEAGNLISSAVKGDSENKVIPAIKYFPGTLDAKNSTDGSDAFLHITKSAGELDASTEFTAFRSGIEAGAGMIMVDHIMVDQLDSERPATLSDKVVPQLLRDKLNYQGVAVTGNMSAGYFAREYKYSTIVKGIFASDIDLILNPNSIQSYVQEIEALLDSGEITEAQLNTKVKRILTLKYQSGMMDDSVNATEAVDATTASTEATGETTGSTEATSLTETTSPTE
ncbi:glycoside hydrolase family 3 N-terminal domain-containing protein [Ruminococcus sp.]|uniref:glycoside hydrolase family 3 N-terminal domain-containing protein n=1 Tax=Ruminococcus sp. TaxID=41978 RepID=UPI0038659838